MSCARTEALTMSYITGELSGTPAEAVERHLDSCPRCRQRYAEELDLLATLGAGNPPSLAGASFTAAVMADVNELPLPGDEQPEEAEIRFLPWARWTWLPALAAAVALVVGLGLQRSRTAAEALAVVEEQAGAAAQVWAEDAGHLARGWYEIAAAALSSSQSLITQSGAHETLIRITTAVAAALCILLIARCRTSLASPNHSHEELKA